MEFEKQEPAALDFLVNNAVVSKFRDAYNAFSERREALGLSNPGTVENIAKEVQRDVFLNNHNFSGLRADITKALSMAPMFQISHALSMGSQGLPPYSFTALYGSPKVFMQASVDSDLGLTGRFNHRWTSAFVSKASVQIVPDQTALSLENDYTGADFTASLKAINPSILDGGLTGMYMGSYMQSITPSLSLGLDAMWQRPSVTYGPELWLSYAARYKGSDWIASAQISSQSGIQASYWRRLTERLETGVNVTLQFVGMGGGPMMGSIGKEGVTTLGAKYDFRQSSFRAQVDSQGRVGCLLEKAIAPAVRVTFSGEIDHAKNAAKLGLAVSLEAADPELMEAQEKLAGDQAPPPF